uniref:Uncharacterized protein n=1 Tax=Arundo donax TaxID=35708 RepID=A0A0A8YE12_ARUDO
MPRIRNAPPRNAQMAPNSHPPPRIPRTTPRNAHGSRGLRPVTSQLVRKGGW